MDSREAFYEFYGKLFESAPLDVKKALTEDVEQIRQRVITYLVNKIQDTEIKLH